MSDTRYPLVSLSLCGQYSIKSFREPQFAGTWAPQPNTKPKKNPTDHKTIATIRPAVRILKMERLDTLKRRRQKKTMLSFVEPYAAEDSNCNANSIYYGKI